jgi:citrate lyase subunit beta/citryl-CoA lyase
MTLDGPMRSMLYVPGNRAEWVRKAARYGADAVVVDLEDSVPDAEVAGARAALGDNVAALREGGQRIVTVRTRAIQRGGMADVETAAAAGVDAVVVPKVSAPVIATVGLRLDELAAPVGIIPTLESAAALATSSEVMTSSDRVVGVFGGSGIKFGDVQVALGFEWTVDLHATRHIASQTVLNARAAGIEHILGGAWVDLADPDGLRRHARAYRALGYTGYNVIHPSQLAVVHEVFAISG